MTLHPDSLAEAAALDGPYRAGGTDLLRVRRLGLAPGEPVDLSGLPELRHIEATDRELHIGALATVREVAAHEEVRSRCPALARAAASIANPNVRALATTGGNVLQHPRCDYFGHPELTCLRKAGVGCPARAGRHTRAVVFDTDPCAAPHPSTLATVLACYDATAHLHGPQGPAALALPELLRAPSERSHHTLRPGHILTAFRVPLPEAGEHAAYVRVSSRALADWPTVEVAARLRCRTTGAGTVIGSARLTAGAVAPRPERLHRVEEALMGRPARAETLATAAALAREGARPLHGSRYKLRQLEAAVLQALQECLDGTG